MQFSRPDGSVCRLAIISDMASDKRVIRFIAVNILVLTASVPCESKFSKDMSPSCTIPSVFYKVLLTNDGPTTLGGSTTFSARVEKRHFQEPSRTHYRFCWESVPDIPERCNNIFSNEDKLHWNKWSNRGLKNVKVTAYFNDDETHKVVCVKNITTATVTDTINANLKASQDSDSAVGVQLNVGPVKLNVDVHDPSHLFEMENIFCWWDFGDGTWLNYTTMNNVTHDFKEDRKYELSVKLFALGDGTLGLKLYNGSARLTLDVSANLAPKLVIYGRPGPKLPNPRKGVVVLAVGVAQFVVKFSDPNHLVRHVHSIWSFRLDGEESQRFSSNDSISHNFTSQSNYTLWVTSTLYTEHNKYLFLKHKNLLIQEPIKDLNLQHSQHAEKITIFNVSCQGSGPFSFCWFIVKNYNNCSLPVNKTCSLTLKRKSCRIVINHTFENPGDYCIYLTAENEVSSAQTHLKVKIPNDDPPTAAGKTKSASIALPIILCIIAVIVLAILVKKWMPYKKRPVERADFDFRDEDSRSISSVDLHMGHRCFPFKVFGRCSKGGEEVYLLSSFGTAKNKSSDLYTEIL